MDRIIEGTLGPLHQLRESVDLTLEQVSDWIADPCNRQQISNLVTLLDAQTQLIACQHRLIAVSRLTEIAASQAPPETVRRACADLLRLRLIDPYKEDKRPAKRPSRRPVATENVLEALERMGQKREPAANGGLAPQDRCNETDWRAQARCNPRGKGQKQGFSSC